MVTTLSFFLILNPLRHCGAAYHAEILGTAYGAERRLFHSSRVEFLFVQDVCELVFGVNVFDLNLGVQIDPVKQPIQSNSVGS